MTEAQILADYANLQREMFATGRIAGTNAEAAIAYAVADLQNMFRNYANEADRLAAMADEVAFSRECFNRQQAA